MRGLDPVGLLALGLAFALKVPTYGGFGEWPRAGGRLCAGFGEKDPALDGGTMEERRDLSRDKTRVSVRREQTEDLA